MANITLERRSLDSARRRTSSIRRRLKRSEPGTPDVAVHVLLPKIFGGQVVPYEDESDNDEGNVPSPDSAVMVATPESMDEIPSISLSNYDDGWGDDIVPIYQLFSGPRLATSPVVSVRHGALSSTAPRNARKKVDTVAPPNRLQTQTPPRPRLDQRGVPYSPETTGSNQSTPRMRCHDLPKIRPSQAAVDRLSGALEQQCHLAEPDDVRCSTVQIVSESRKSSIGFLNGSLELENRQSRSCEKAITTRRRMRSRGGKIAFDFNPKLKEAASW